MIDFIIFAAVFIITLVIIDYLPMWTREICAALGFIVVGLWIAGMFDIGNFRFYYGP